VTVRDVITVLGSATVVWPFTGRAKVRVRRVGVLLPLITIHLDKLTSRFSGKLCCSRVGRRVATYGIDVRWCGEDPELIRKYVAELVASGPDASVSALRAGV